MVVRVVQEWLSSFLSFINDTRWNTTEYLSDIYVSCGPFDGLHLGTKAGSQHCIDGNGGVAVVLL